MFSLLVGGELRTIDRQTLRDLKDSDPSQDQQSSLASSRVNLNMSLHSSFNDNINKLSSSRLDPKNVDFSFYSVDGVIEVAKNQNKL